RASGAEGLQGTVVSQKRRKITEAAVLAQGETRLVGRLGGESVLRASDSESRVGTVHGPWDRSPGRRLQLGKHCLAPRTLEGTHRRLCCEQVRSEVAHLRDREQ